MPDTPRRRAAERLASGESSLAIIGLGYLGYSNLLRYVRHGIHCLATDYNGERLSDFADGRYPPSNRFAYWKAVNELNYGRSAGAQPFEVVSPDEIVSRKVAAYLVCVPYDYREAALSEEIRRTIQLLRRMPIDERPIVVFEAFFKPFTMARGVVPEFQRAGLDPAKDFVLAYAPREDWYLEEFEREAVRKVACIGPDAADEIRTLFALTSQEAIVTGDFTAVELSECFDHAVHHAASSLLNQMMFAYPEQDIREVVRLHRNGGGPLRPGVSNAGSKVSLASQFLIDAAPRPGYLTLAADTLSSGFSVQQRLVEILQQRGVRRAALLGLIPHENTAEYKSDPALLVPQLLQQAGIDVRVNDPFIAPEEIEALAGTHAFEFPEGLQGADAVMILTSHTAYQLIARPDLVRILSGCRLVLDNTGIWRRHRLQDAGIEYRVLGEAGSLLE